MLTRALFVLSPELVSALRALRNADGNDELARQYDAFLLDPGLGPATYLTADGRILWYDDGWGVKGTRCDALAAIRCGMHKTQLKELGALLPPRTADALDCGECHGDGGFQAPNGEELFFIVCMRCAGVGWTSASLSLDEVVANVI